MSSYVSDTLPAEFVSAFDGTGLEGKIGPICLVLTVDEDGTPRACMLSAGEVLVVAPRAVRLALWPGTRTSANCRRGSRLLLCFIAPATVLYVKGVAQWLGADAGAGIECVEVRVERVESDLHQGFPVVQGPLFRCEDSDSRRVLTAWRPVLEALKKR